MHVEHPQHAKTRRITEQYCKCVPIEGFKGKQKRFLKGFEMVQAVTPSKAESFSAIEFCRQVGVDLHILNYAARRAGVEPMRRVGVARLFDPCQRFALESALRRYSRTYAERAR